MQPLINSIQALCTRVYITSYNTPREVTLALDILNKEVGQFRHHCQKNVTIYTRYGEKNTAMLINPNHAKHTYKADTHYGTPSNHAHHYNTSTSSSNSGFGTYESSSSSSLSESDC